MIRRFGHLSGPVRRAILLVAVAAVTAPLYGLLLVWFHVTDGPREQQFGAPADRARMALYLQPVLVDPLNETMQFRITVMPARGDAGTPTNVADRDLLLLIRRGTQTEHVPVRAGQQYPEQLSAFDLQTGSIRTYPLDEYTADVHLALLDPTAGVGVTALPIHVTSWQGIFGYIVHGKQLTASTQGEVLLRFRIDRTGAIAFFGMAMYAAMVVLAGCALTIGTLVFLGVRRIEVTLVGALGAITFALPALRNNLPGTPPLGIWADVVIFFWAELIAVLALCLFLVAWSRRGNPP